MSLTHDLHLSPPLTCNNLSVRQKAQLRRSTDKIMKVLGAPPHLLGDFTGPIHVDLSLSRSRSSSDDTHGNSGLKTKSKRHGRSRTVGERFHPDSYPLSTCTPPRTSRAPSVDSGYHSSDSRRAPTPTVSATNALPTRKLSRKSTNVVSVPKPMCDTSRPGSRAQMQMQPPASRESLCDSLYDPPFVIQSENALRRAKMARVAKRLGEGVPVRLVFGDEDKQEVKVESRDARTSEALCESPSSTSSEYPPSSLSSHTASTSSTTSHLPTILRPIHESDGIHGRREFPLPSLRRNSIRRVPVPAY